MRHSPHVRLCSRHRRTSSRCGSPRYRRPTRSSLCSRTTAATLRWRSSGLVRIPRGCTRRRRRRGRSRRRRPRERLDPVPLLSACSWPLGLMASLSLESFHVPNDESMCLVRYAFSAGGTMHGRRDDNGETIWVRVGLGAKLKSENHERGSGSPEPSFLGECPPLTPPRVCFARTRLALRRHKITSDLTGRDGGPRRV